MSAVPEAGKNMPERSERPAALLIGLVLLACLALNLGLYALRNWVGIFLYLDMVGTALAAIALGPALGACVGVITNGITAIFYEPSLVWFGLVQIVGALVWGYGMRRYGMGRTIPRFLALNIIVAVCCTIVATPIVYFVGASTHDLTAHVGKTLQVILDNALVDVTGTTVIHTILDKTISGFLAIACLSLIPRSVSNAAQVLSFVSAEDLASENESLRQLSSTDALSGLNNRRSFDETITTEWGRAQRHAYPLSLLFIDIDHFKAYNDHYGHTAGDLAIKKVASALRSSASRAGDFMARYGGEEFVILLPNSNLAQAEQVAKNVLEAVRKLAIEHKARGDGTDHVTVSVGIGTNETCASATELIECADEALYQAKRQGRDQFSRAARNRS